MNQFFKKISLFTRSVVLLGETPYLRSVQRGLLTALPLVLTGVFFVCLVNFPSQMVHDFFDKVFSPRWRSFCDMIIQGTFGIVSLAVTCSIGFHIARLTRSGTHSFASTNQGQTSNFNRGDSNIPKPTQASGESIKSPLGTDESMHPGITPIINVMVVLSCYIILVGSPDNWQNMFSMSKGLIMAIFAGVSASSVFIRLTRSSRMSFPIVGNDPATSEVMALVPAAALTILFFALLRAFFFLLFPKGIDITGMIVSTLFYEEIGGLSFGLLYTGVSQLLWFFGIHGPNVLFPIEQSTMSVAMIENINAALAFQPPPHIVTKGFLDVFAYMGGSGCTLCLILAILYKSRNQGNRKLCYLAIIPAIFNVNEPLLFGIPLVFNPLYIIPFLLTPMLQVLVAYLATAADLVPRTIASSHWTTPALLSGYIVTHSLSATALQAVNIVLGILTYLPFVMLSDKIHDKQLSKAMQYLQAYVKDKTIDSNGKKCMSRPGMEGHLAHILAEDLNMALGRSLNAALPPSVTQSLNETGTCPHFTKADPGHIANSKSDSIFLPLYSAVFHSHQKARESGHLFLLFQPQVSTLSHDVQGVECLVQWEHPVYGFVPPQIIVALAEENKIIDALGSFIFRSACAQYTAWHGHVSEQFLMSVDLSERQLDNSNLAREILDILKATGTPACNLEVGLTESLAITPNSATLNILNELRSRGVNVAINDFWMGHISLQYLKEFPINAVKITRSLTMTTTNDINEHIIRSIKNLSQDLNIRTLVVGVETQEQCQRLQKTGCFLFQGPRFSPPLHPDQCLEYITGYPVVKAPSVIKSRQSDKSQLQPIC